MVTTQSPAPYGSPGLVFGAYGGDTGYTKNSPHKGQDHQWLNASVAKSRETYAPVGGTVMVAFNDGGYHDGWGNYVSIRVDTTDGQIVEARLAHHATGSVQVKVGQRIAAGVRIGTMGDSGKAKGIHLHEELWVAGFRTDPVHWRTHDLPGTPASAGGGSQPFDPEGFLMALSDIQQRQIYEALVSGGQSASAYYKTDAAINILREELKPVIEAIRAGDIKFPGQNWNAFDTLVNVAREPLSAAEIEAIAVATAAKVGTGSGGAGPTAEAIARAVRAEFAVNPLK